MRSTFLAQMVSFATVLSQGRAPGVQEVVASRISSELSSHQRAVRSHSGVLCFATPWEASRLTALAPAGAAATSAVKAVRSCGFRLAPFWAAPSRSPSSAQRYVHCEGDGTCPSRPPEPTLGSSPFFLVKECYASSSSTCVWAHRWVPMGGCRSLRCSFCVLSRSCGLRSCPHRVQHLRFVDEGDFRGPAGGIQWALGTATWFW